MYLGPAFLTFIIGLLITGFPVFFWGLRHFKKYKLIKNLPTSKIDSAAVGGVIEIQGKIIDDPLFKVKSPISKKECACFHWVIEERIGTDKLKLLEPFYSHEYIIVNDGGDSHACVPIKAIHLWESALYTTKYTYRRNSKKMPKMLRELINNSEISEKGFLFSSVSYNVKETIYLRNENLFFLGHAFEVNDSKLKIKFNELYKNYYSDLKQDRYKLRDFDLNKDGKISKDELVNVKKYAFRETAKKNPKEYCDYLVAECTLKLDRHEENRKFFDFTEVFVSKDLQSVTLESLKYNAKYAFSLGPFLIGLAAILATLKM